MESLTPPVVFTRHCALSDYHSLRSIAHGLSKQHFHSYEDAKKWVDSWIASKDMLFFRHKIHMLPEKWEKVVSSDGQYFQRHVFLLIFKNKALIFTKKNKENLFSILI